PGRAPARWHSFSPFSSCPGAPIELLATACAALGESRAVGFVPLTVELDANLMGAATISGWSTEHGVIRISPVPDLAGETDSTQVSDKCPTS
ncbi:MAG: hypothetical protein AAF602_19105, partial [Myxococcota bacterium]